MHTATAPDLHRTYQAQRDQLAHDLTGRTQFPVQVELGGLLYSSAIWQGEQLPDQLLAFDTETAAILASKIPELALAAVHGDQGSCFYIHASNLARFWMNYDQ